VGFAQGAPDPRGESRTGPPPAGRGNRSPPSARISCCDHRAASLRRATDFSRGRATREILARLREGRPSEIRAPSGAISHFALASRRVGPVRDSPRGSGRPSRTSAAA